MGRSDAQYFACVISEVARGSEPTDTPSRSKWGETPSRGKWDQGEKTIGDTPGAKLSLIHISEPTRP